MTSPLPPRLRDTRSVPDRVRQDRNNLKQLGVGFVGGRFAPAKPLGSTSQFGDLEDDTADEQIAFTNVDQATASVAGVVTLALKYEPLGGSLHVRWNGIDQPPTEWTLNGQTVTFANVHIKAGDALTAAYAYLDVEPDAVPDPGAYYPFDEPSGVTFVDASGNGYNGTHSAVTDAQPSLLTSGAGYSAQWNGSTSHSFVPYGSWMNAPAISATVLFKTTGSGTLIAREQNSGGLLWNMRIGTSFGGSGPKLGMVFGGVFFQPIILTPGPNVNDGVRHMAGFSYEGTTLRMYIDGVKVLTYPIVATYTGTAGLSFGGAPTGSGDSYSSLYAGFLDEARYWPQSGVLTDDDFAALWTDATA